MSLYYTKNGKNGHMTYGNGHNHNGHNHNGHGDMSFMHDELDVVQGDVDMTLKLQSPDFLEQFELDLPPVDLSAIETATHDILEAVGENPQREGLQRTPNRVARAYDELLSGYRVDPAKLINEAVFSVEYDDMVIVRDIEFYSMCEHHMLPFIGRAHVAYLSNGKVIGLSKIPRIVDMFARRLQVQERMTHQIAQFLNEVLEPRGVAVVLDGVHMCSMMRGVQKSQSSMTTSAMLGVFREDEKIRAEFLNQISRSGSSGIFGA